VTFRSFSRFVRWYRWTILFTLVGLAHFEYLDRGEWKAAAVCAYAVAIFKFGWPGQWWAYRVKARAKRIADARLARHAADIRSQPLRGWTK
jgi:hypothetical protein